ncbi:hypothetical protein L249_3519 [Ophiocordyceps polyrhachis-furcata BCC 54312]|uniref:Uncharacterized protein n=1 Tax=Ophiocordyceps polyrhachis-furcata BCC 54312 TaxID=1330021 RepID=A0A367LM60_9HYPO|nr:hypothetical protein L249_3519 [Ophiocordyceps polyrhachis-furcata BCC 54312]
MWDRLLLSSSSSSSSTGTATMAVNDDARLLRKLPSDPFSNALGISNAPYRYEVRRGKVVPRLDVNISPSPLHRQPSSVHEPSPSRRMRSEAVSAMPQYELASGGIVYAEEQISPPSSPGLGYTGLEHDVSPIDNEPLPFRQAVDHPSATRRALNQQSRTDETKRSRGRHLLPSRAHDSPSAHASSQQVPLSVHNQRTRLVHPKSEPSKARPPWKGASGRSAIVPPIYDDLYVAPLNIRRKSSAKTAGSETCADGDKTTPAMAQQPLTSTQGPAAGPCSGHSYEPYHHYPSPPDSEVCTPSPPSSWFEPSFPAAASDRVVIKKKPVRAAAADTSAAVVSSSGREAVGVSEDAWTQPASRFSVTTCATSLPPTPQQSAFESGPPVSADSGARSRSGEERRSCSSTSVKSQQPRNDSLPPRLNAMKNNHSLVANRDTSGAFPRSVAKPLPLAPPELSQSSSLIAQLNVQMQSLVHRRFNLNRSIQKMTELMPSDSFLASDDVLRKREKEKRKVQALKDELAIVQRDEYEVGLKLHRAYKRQERDEDFQQSVLWVKRVTG